MSRDMENDGDGEVSLEAFLPPLVWATPRAKLDALRAIKEHMGAPENTLQQQIAKLDLYHAAQRLFAQGVGLPLEVDGQVDWTVNRRFLTLYETFHWEEGRAELNRQIEELDVATDRQLRLGEVATTSVLELALSSVE